MAAKQTLTMTGTSPWNGSSHFLCDPNTVVALPIQFGFTHAPSSSCQFSLTVTNSTTKWEIYLQFSSSTIDYTIP